MLKFEIVPDQWLDKLGNIKPKHLKEPLGGIYWYNDLENQYSVYPVDEYEIISTSIDGKYYAEQEYTIALILSGKVNIITALFTISSDKEKKKNELSSCPESISEKEVKDIILHCFNQFSGDVRKHERLIDRANTPLIFEPVPETEKWRDKLVNEKESFRINDENYWYVNREKQFAIYPLSWVPQSIVRCAYGEEQGTFVIIFKNNYYKCSVSPIYIREGWNQKNKLSISPELKEIEEDIKSAIVCWHRHFYYDKKAYESTNKNDMR